MSICIEASSIFGVKRQVSWQEAGAGGRSRRQEQEAGAGAGGRRQEQGQEAVVPFVLVRS